VFFPNFQQKVSKVPGQEDENLKRQQRRTGRGEKAEQTPRSPAGPQVENEGRSILQVEETTDCFIISFFSV
jgi:hypothetical protein